MKHCIYESDLKNKKERFVCTEKNEDVIDFARIVNIFGSSSALICIVFCLTDSEDEGLLLTRISDVPFSIVSPTASTTTRVYSLSIKENL